MKDRYVKTATAVGIGLLMAFFFLIFIRYADASNSIQALEFDLDTITAQDYTIEFKISKQHYRVWLDSMYEEGNVEVPAVQLKKHMQSKIESILNKHEHTFN